MARSISGWATFTFVACGSTCSSRLSWEGAHPMLSIQTIHPEPTRTYFIRAQLARWLLAPVAGLQVIEGVFINESGEITGNAITPEGNTHAVVLIPCNESHPNRLGCDYSDVDESEATLSGVAGPTATSGPSVFHDRLAAMKKMPGQ
jgi:hypothetical protein